MSTHTQGPWSAIKWSCHHATTVVVEDSSHFSGKRIIAECESEQDACLIAASPDLLAALRGVLRVADRATDEFDAARVAIAKATGTPP